MRFCRQGLVLLISPVSIPVMSTNHCHFSAPQFAGVCGRKHHAIELFFTTTLGPVWNTTLGEFSRPSGERTRRGRFKESNRVKIRGCEKTEGSQSHGIRKDAHRERKPLAPARRSRRP